MLLPSLLEASNRLAVELRALLNVPLFDGSERTRVSEVARSMSLEHWDATRAMLAGAMLPSALVVHRAQFEALLRSVWVLYAAAESSVAKLDAALNTDSEQAAKNLPMVKEMMDVLATKAPSQVFEALTRFKDGSWKALNSYAHAGLHPLQRHAKGYPEDLSAAVLRNANGLAIVAGMQGAVLSGQQSLMGRILTLGISQPSIMPALL